MPYALMTCDWYCGSALICASVMGSGRRFFSENARVWSFAYFDAGLLDKGECQHALGLPHTRTLPALIATVTHSDNL